VALSNFLRLSLFAAVCGVIGVQPAWAQPAEAAWPTKPLRVIVAYPPGSSPDMQARLIAQPLSAVLGQPVVVENRPGASGNIGADALARAGDGYTIGVIGNGPLTSSRFLYSKLPYDPVKDFAPIVLLGSAPLVWVQTKGANPVSPAQYIAQTRAAGDKLAYGSIGAGSGGHLGMELIKEATGIQALHVPFAGGPAILNAMLGNQVQMTLLPGSTVQPMVSAGKLQAVAVTSATRSSLMPDVPSLPELGVKGVNVEVWNAVMAPANMPESHQARLNEALAKILHSDEIKRKLFEQGWVVQDTSRAALRARILSDTTLYGKLIADKHIKLE
jgi:tripartite-type tricarboxylate transporter receptor subunit TctC